MRMMVVVLAGLSGAVGHGAPVSDSTTYGGAGVRGAFIGAATGARAVGMGEAYTAVAEGASAAAWNPGGLGQLTSFSAEAMFDAVGAGIGISYAAVAVPAGSFTVGGSVTMLGFGSYELRDEVGLRTGSAGVNDLAAGLSGAMPNPAWLGGRGWSGVCVEMVKETVGGSLIGIGAGSLVPFPGGITAGWAIQHLGPSVGGFSLPSSAKIGISYMQSRALRVAADCGYLPGARSSFIAFGAEYLAARSLTLRAGYRYRDPTRSPEGMAGISAGAGIRVRDFRLDYAFQPFGDLAISHRVALVYGPDGRDGSPAAGFVTGTARAGRSPVAGSTPDLDVQQPAAGDSGISGAVLFAAARILFREGDYRGAWGNLSEVLTRNPRDARAWQLLGNCQYKLGDTAGALKSFGYALRFNPDNPALKAWVDSLNAPK